MSSQYETVYLLSPDLAADTSTKFHEKIDKLFTAETVKVIDKKDWGKRKLAYLVGKSLFGHYHYCHFETSGLEPNKSFVDELERILRIDESVLRFLTVRLDKRKTKMVTMVEDAKLKVDDRPYREFSRRPDGGRPGHGRPDHARPDGARLDGARSSETKTSSPKSE